MSSVFQHSIYGLGFALGVGVAPHGNGELPAARHHTETANGPKLREEEEERREGRQLLQGYERGHWRRPLHGGACDSPRGKQLDRD